MGKTHRAKQIAATSPQYHPTKDFIQSV